MRFSTAAILSVALIGGMFLYPAVILAIFLPASNQGLTPLPIYQQILFEIAAFCLTWRFFLALPIISVLFTIAGFTYPKTAPKASPSTPRMK